ncbi:hypothetical protein BDB00DRAFT_937938 [Zychaea mexicana]|uniref:uncharacterized protein n=1 Tax=Zychaea mexicana TaxID=64656 RepID=UPI0022FEDAD2|nr:uncharacterized protein BDB00DRAFT_937938 [Zychaea mexicana]KAI9494853.1 hypothetical protein BDB00DRAFT_937938 [Zychaea mexicana]
MHYYIKKLTWAIVRERSKEVTDKLLPKTQESTGSQAHLLVPTKKQTPLKKTQKVTRPLRSGVQQSKPLKVCTADEQQEDDEAATSEDAETSTRKIRALVSIIKRLLDKATEDVSAQTIKDAAFQGTNLAHSECKAAAHICNALRPYYMPASDENDDDDTDDKDSLTIHQCAPLAYITNTANQWATFPSVDEKDQSLHISTDVLYTLFSGDFKIPAETPKGEITSKREAVDWRRKRDVFGAFFKLPKIQQAMESKKLTLAYRVTFVNRHTVRVLGTRTVTTGDSDRRDKETAKEKEQDNSSGDDDSNIGSDEGTSVAKVASKGQASRSKGKGRAGAGLSGKNRSAKARKKKKQKAQRRKRKSQDEERRPRKRHAAQKEDKADIEELKTNLGQRIRRLASRLPGLLKECGTLEEKRADIGRQFRRRTKMKEAWILSYIKSFRLQELQSAMSQLYVAEMHCIGKDVAKGIVPDDKIESTVQKTILESLQNNNPLAVAGIDPGHVVAATAVLTTTTHIFDTIQQYTDGLIAPLPPSFASSSATTQEQGIPQQSSISLPTPLPKPHIYTSKKKNSATFATKHQKRREIFKRKGIDDADRRYKEGRTRELRHKIYHSKLASAWRLPGIKSTLHFFGSWRAGNKGFKKHQQGASKKLKQELDAPENSHLCITDEYRSSKTCP